ncbi:MAG: class I SAM-dependent methyltransferase [Candidatus Competibacteraceae bacterium]|nr:class I SAM-dependent methyltransferase [Candidatus Competibacteraceae bacterium]
MDNSGGRAVDDQHWLGLQQWYLTPLGQLFAETQTAHLASVLTPLFGQHLLVLGVPLNEAVFFGSTIPHRIHLYWPQSAGTAGDVLVKPTELPIAKECIDVAILCHALEFLPEPYAVLQEIDRVLIAGGHVLIAGFNPYSLWNIKRWLGFNHQLQGGRPISVPQLQRWLARIDCEVMALRYGFYRPPLTSLAMLQKLAFMERLGARWWPMLGSGYVVLAKKRVIPLTPLKMHWRVRRYALPVGVNQPSCGNRM